MNESTTPETNEKKPAKFDLSDGLSSEDFIALGSGLLRLIVFILKIIFFPLIWVKRTLVKLGQFLFSSHAERLLTEDEKLLVSSVPIFLGFLGLTTGGVFAVIAYLNNRDNFISHLQDITNILGYIGSLIQGFFQFLGLIWGFIYQVIIQGTKSFIIDNIFGQNVNPVIPFLSLSLIGFIGAIVILVVLELSFVQTFLEKVSDTVNYIVTFPFRLYERIQGAWNGILKKLGDPVMGGEDMLNTYTNKFYQKALLYILLFAVITICSGLYIFFTNPSLSHFNDTNSYLFLLIVMVLAGLFAGYPVAYLIVSFLQRISKDKYEMRTHVPTAAQPVGASSTSAETKAVPVANLKGKTAKERAMERRRLREQQKK